MPGSRRPDSYKPEHEVEEASREAMRGGVAGAAKAGLVAAVGAATAHALLPGYRGLTIQFKIFLQLSVMMLGGAIEGDRRLRLYELQVRERDRRMRARRERNRLDALVRELEKEEEELAKR